MLDAQHLECVRACQEAISASQICIDACREDNPQAMARCIALALDCSDLCALTANAIARKSEHLDAICALCAQACLACNEECQRHANIHCQRCAEASYYCAEACHHIMQSHVFQHRLHLSG